MNILMISKSNKIVYGKNYSVIIIHDVTHAQGSDMNCSKLNSRIKFLNISSSLILSILRPLCNYDYLLTMKFTKNLTKYRVPF